MMKILAFIFGLALLAIPQAARADYVCSPAPLASASSRSIQAPSGVIYNLNGSGCAVVNQAADVSWFSTQGFTDLTTVFIAGALLPGTAATNLGYVSVTSSPYIADPTGATDSTAAFNAAVAANATVYVPPGTYSVCGVILPSTANFHLFGAGEASILKQGSCGSPALKWSQIAMSYNAQVISDLGFDASAGAANTIDTSGQGTLTLRHLFFNNIPTGHDNIYVNGTSSTQTHDVRLIDISAYNIGGGNAGFAKVEFGPLAADSSIDMMNSNGNFTDQHAIAVDAGAAGIFVSNSHPYNTISNVVLNQGSYNTFANDTIDNASSADVFHNQGASHTQIIGCYIEAVHSGYSGITSTGSSGTLISGARFVSSSGAVSAVSDDATSGYTIVDGADIGVLANYSNVFNLQGLNSYATHVPGYAPLGLLGFYSGTTSAAQAQATTSYLGQLGGASAYYYTAFTVGSAQTITNASIAVNATPPSGQSMVFTLYDNSTSLGSCTIAAGAYGCSISASYAAVISDSVYIQSVFSATSGSANVRYSINYRG